jgi:dCMP deaminase
MNAFLNRFASISSLIIKCSQENRRPTWDEYGIIIANVASLRSQDPNTKVGACALRHDNSIASIGYNGAPQGVEIDWNNREEKLKRVIHSELNCLKYCLPGDVKTLYITHSPCVNCLALIASYKIKRVVFQESYHRDTTNESEKIAKEFNIELIKYDNKNSN